MSKGIRIIIGICITAVITIITVFILSIHVTKQSLPKTSGKIILSDLRATIKIYRDDYGIPHIFARNEEDLFFAMGFVHAQDRLWQMDMFRRVAEGTVSEIYGERTVPIDRFFKKIGFYRSVDQMVEQLAPESKIILAQYAAGVNAFIEAHRHNFPIEFSLLAYNPRLWEIKDSYICQRLLPFVHSLARQYDLVLGALNERFDHQKIKEILPENFQLPSEKYQSYKELTKLQEQIQTVLNLISPWIPVVEENSAWLVSGAMTSTGKPLFANNPATSLTVPPLWYEMHIVAPFIHCYGATRPGLPIIISGHNPTFAWALNEFPADDLDFFLEKIDSTSYQSANKWYPLNLATEAISIREQQPETLIVRSTNHGPVLVEQVDNAISLQWTGLNFSDEIIGGYRILKVQNITECASIIKNFHVPVLKILLADSTGSIAEHLVGNIPNRNIGQGNIAQPGWTGNFDWLGFIPSAALPYSINPPQQFLISFDNKRYSPIMPSLPGPAPRLKRLFQLLENRKQMSIDYLKSMQLDQFSMQGEVMSPFIDAVLRDYYAKDDLLNYFCDRIMKWNFQMDAHEVAPAIFNVFVWKLLSNTFQDEMGDTLYQQFIKSPTFAMQVLDQLRQKPVSTWFDDVNTSQTETMNDIIFRSLDDTFQYFVQQQGIVVEDWNWGHLHHIQLEHPFSDRQHYHSFLTIGNYPCGGGNCTIDAAQFLFTAPFQSSILSSLRQLIHVGDIKNSCSVLITGQSGQPLDPHYRDQVDLWLNGQYHPMLMDVHRIMESAFDLLTLEPK